MTSPFKLLDPYSKEDKEIFFGRKDEIDQLFKLVFQANIVLLYGPSGTGKTSLIDCGLANRFRDTDWLPLFVRRKRDLNQSLREEIAEAAETPIPESADLVRAVGSLYLDALRPVYLIFDQFEELFVLGTAEEQRIFIEGVAALLKSDVSCKIIISLREEYLAKLYGFEKVVPELFAKRLRVEPMSMSAIEEVITGTAKQFGITLEDPVPLADGRPSTAQRIIEKLSDPRTGVQLSWLQVYLDRLYDGAEKTPEASGGPPRVVFTNQLVERTGALGDVLANFLEVQTAAIQKRIGRREGGPADAVQQVLEAFTTPEGTKRPMSRADIAAQLPGLAPVLDEILGALRTARILRQTDELDELAHDALAGSISDRQNAHRKTLALLKKKVTDRLAAFDEERAFLTRKEVAQLRPYESELMLTDEEARFVLRSRGRAGLQQFGWTLAVALIALTVLSAGALAVGSVVSKDVRAFVVHRPAMFAIAKISKEEWVNQSDDARSKMYELVTRSITLADLEALAKDGIAKAEYLLAFRRQLDDDEPQYAQLMKRAADKGLAVAEYEMATIYDVGAGVAANPDLAMKYYKRAALHGNMSATEVLANERYKADDIPGALTILTSALKTHPNDWVLLTARADIYALQEKHKEAAADYLVLEGKAVGPDQWNLLCWNQASRNFQLERALKACNAALNAAPRDPTAKPGTGSPGGKRRDGAKLSEEDRAKLGAIYDSRGLVFMQLGRFKDALAEYEMAVTYRPGEADTLYCRGLAKLALNQVAEGEADRTKARELEPEIDQRLLDTIVFSPVVANAVGTALGNDVESQ